MESGKKTKMEFAIKMHDPETVNQIKKYLYNTGNFLIEKDSDRVIVNTDLPWSDIKSRLEKTGKRAVLVGFGDADINSTENTSAINNVKGSSAVAMINDNQDQIKGIVRFCSIDTTDKEGCVIDGTIDGLTPGLHGIHIHECGDLSMGCESVGDHYNPRNSPHGSPDDPPTQRHAGDLGNIRADENGRATFRFTDPILQVTEIIGRSVVVTENSDDAGKGQNKKSKIDGNSGRRLACGIIARAAGIFQNYKKICACDGVTLWDERDVPIAGGTRIIQSKE